MSATEIFSEIEEIFDSMLALFLETVEKAPVFFQNIIAETFGSLLAHWILLGLTFVIVSFSTNAFLRRVSFASLKKKAYDIILFLETYVPVSQNLQEKGVISFRLSDLISLKIPVAQQTNFALVEVIERMLARSLFIRIGEFSLALLIIFGGVPIFILMFVDPEITLWLIILLLVIAVAVLLCRRIGTRLDMELKQIAADTLDGQTEVERRVSNQLDLFYFGEAMS